MYIDGNQRIYQFELRMSVCQSAHQFVSRSVGHLIKWLNASISFRFEGNCNSDNACKTVRPGLSSIDNGNEISQLSASAVNGTGNDALLLSLASASAFTCPIADFLSTLSIRTVQLTV